MFNDTEVELCDCGRAMLPVHCPSCGQRSSYALKNKIVIPNPSTGLNEEVTVYRCRQCNRNYNDHDRLYYCKAPVLIKRNKQEEKEVLSEQYKQRALSGESFDYVDKLKFRRIVGLRYEDFMLIARKAGIKSLADIQRPKEQSEEPSYKHYTGKAAPPTSVDGFKDTKEPEDD
jgi:hypothetical protein